MSSPFTSHPLQPARSLLDKLARRSNADAASKALETLLASGAPKRISIGDVRRIMEEQGLTEPQVRSLSSRMWRKALMACIEDEVITEEEAKYLFALRRVLDVSEDDVIGLEAELVHPVYQKALNEVLADGTLSALERSRLERLRKDLRIGKALADSMTDAVAKEAFRDVMEAALSDRLLTMEERDRLTSIAADFKIDLDENSQVRMNRALLRWFYSTQAELPSLTVPVTLREDEKCHFFSSVAWKEMRKERSYGQSFDALKTIDVGTIYITNERLLFDGQSKNTSVKIRDLVSVTLHRDAVQFDRGSGRSVYLDPMDSELADLLGQAILRAQRQRLSPPKPLPGSGRESPPAVQDAHPEPPAQQRVASREVPAAHDSSWSCRSWWGSKQ